MIWLYIKELAGKDLDLSTIVKFILYGLPKLIPLVLPLTILLTSIMVFGNFAENYEFAAMKSTGISLQRAMASLAAFVIILGFVAFWFANNIIPWGEENFINLRKNLAKVKPSMAIAEGQFNEIESTNYNIKVAKKTGDNDQFLEDVIIHEKASDGRKNATVIVAKNGELLSNEDSDVIKLVLYEGNYYKDTYPRKAKDRIKHPFAKSSFEKYTMNIDISNFNTVDIDDKTYKNRYNMLNITELDYTLDSLSKKHDNVIKDFAKTMYGRSSIQPFSTIGNIDNLDIDEELEGVEYEYETANKAPPQNEIALDSTYTGSLLEFFNASKNNGFLDRAVGDANSTQQLIERKITILKGDTKWYNRHIISFHEKLALPFACIILFFVGAPLGALIRKGGIGLPLVIAILLFLTYHFIGIFALNSAKNGGFPPVLASWFSTLIMLPLSVYLTKKATADKGLFESEGILEPLKKLFKIKKEEKEIDTSVFDTDTNEYTTLFNYNEKELIKVIKNYRQYGYSRTHRNTAVSILNSRGVTNQQLKFSGNFDNQKFVEGIRLKYKYDEDSKLTFILYAIAIPIIITGLILNNNNFPFLGKLLLTLGSVIGIIYLFALIKSFVSNSNLYKHLEKESTINGILYFLIGLPLYFVFYLFQKRTISQALYLKSNKTFTQKALDGLEEPKVDTASIASPLKDYKDHSLFAIIVYSLSTLLFVSYFIFKNNKLEPVANAVIQLSVVSLVLFIIYYFKSLINIFTIYNIDALKNKKPNIFLVVIGIPLYVLIFILFRNKIKNEIE